MHRLADGRPLAFPKRRLENDDREAEDAMTAKRIDDATYSIEDGFVRCFLIIGGERALLVDSGVSGDGALDVARSLTSLPVGLVNTHADRDHIAGNTAFGHFMMHPAEAANYYNVNGGKGDFTPLEDGQVLELGGRRIEVVLIPGHTPGSIALIDRERGMLFPGDSVQDGNIFMFGAMRDMHAYILSLKKLETIEDCIDAIYPSHGSIPLSSSFIRKLREKAVQCLEGKLPSAPFTLPDGNTVTRQDAQIAAFLT